MKKCMLLALMAFLSAAVFAQKINISYEFKGIEPGYDHQTRCIMFVDGVETAVSEANLQSKGGKFSAKVEPGKHAIRIVNYALYEGNWEAHTVENDYSLDCSFEADFEFEKKKSKLNIDLIFNLDKGTTFVLSGKNYSKE